MAVRAAFFWQLSRMRWCTKRPAGSPYKVVLGKSAGVWRVEGVVEVVVVEVVMSVARVGGVSSAADQLRPCASAAARENTGEFRLRIARPGKGVAGEILSRPPSAGHRRISGQDLARSQAV